MIVAAEDVTKQTPALPSRHGQHPEPEIEHVDRTAVVEMPSVTGCGGEGHLPGR